MLLRQSIILGAVLLLSGCGGDDTKECGSGTVQQNGQCAVIDAASSKDAALSDAITSDGANPACNPAAAPGDQGCGAQEKCTWLRLDDNGAGNIACVPDGDVDDGGNCEVGAAGSTTGYDNCSAGLVCVSGTCAPVCDASDDQCPENSVCTRYSGIFTDELPAYGGCAASCDPVAQTSCPKGEGCYILVSNTTSTAVCAAAGTVGFYEVIEGGSFANSCVPGAMPRARANDTGFECGPLCQVNDVYQGNNEADEGGVAPYTCESRGAAAPNDMAEGESCRYWWAREPFDTLSPYSNTVGWCVAHAKLQYDTNGDMTSDAPFPRCINLTLGDVVLPVANPPHNDAQYFWCVAEGVAKNVLAKSREAKPFSQQPETLRIKM